MDTHGIRKHKYNTHHAIDAYHIGNTTQAR